MKIPKIINGFEGHTKEKLVKYEELKIFIGNCIANTNGYEMDDLLQFIEEL